MSSGIDATKPVAGSPQTASVRSNFSAAKVEINELQRLITDSVVAGGTAQALTADFVNNVTLDDGTTIVVEALLANTGSNPTLDVDSTGAKTILKENLQALVADDISGAGHMMVLKYKSASDAWILLNPAPSAVADDVYDQVQTDIGTTIQAYDAKTAKLDIVQSWTAQQTFKEIKDTVYSLTGTSIDPANGHIQYKTLGGNTTFSYALDSGQSVTLLLADGSGYTATWPTTRWLFDLPPDLPTSGYALIEFFKVGSSVYGIPVGDI